MMHRQVAPAFATIVMTLSCSAYSAPTDDLAAFYANAAALTQSPPQIDALLKICERQRGSYYLSFWGIKEGKATLTVFAANPVSDLSKVVSLRVLFNPSPTARPGPAASLDWGYIFDRNGDGKVDYLVYLDGARPIAPDEFPADYPKGGRAAKLTLKNVELVLKSSRLVFIHYADDNFDGTVDTMVAPLPDPDRQMWIQAYGVLRSSRFDGVVDQEWAFRHRITEATGRVPRTERGYMMVHIEPPKILEGSQWLANGTDLLKLINEGAHQCQFGAGSFVKE